ncbi:hypothetical protein GCM10010196_30800 [Agromyces mediolanus]|uniref:Uncharacterized protein n=2 Tax=Agromyces mediolanus TaxID=41986 RepID=A0A918KUJ2_AGRME|nr:hypothetical protein GCM10010196_30800 [Agromyces mediolanus]GLJ74130.1 hypothetical protein GCM10017583_33890 [Agromyces mediolanus]
MRRAIGRMLRALAPRTAEGMTELAEIRSRYGGVLVEIERLRAENVELREDLGQLVARLDEASGEIDELRRDAPRIAELYDLVFERLAERR